jgi:hypothetical protein
VLRRIGAALVEATSRLLSRPSDPPPRYKTGAVVVEQAPSSVLHERFVEAGAEQPPADRSRMMTPYVREEWEAVPQDLGDVPMHALAAAVSNGVVPLAGWRVRQVFVAPARTWTSLNAYERSEVLISIGQGQRHEDHIYNGYYPTIKGNDVAHHDPKKAGSMEAFQGGSVLKGRATKTHDGTIRGGTEITQGKRQYREATKNYVEVGPGYFAHVERIRAAKQAERDRQHKIAVEKQDALLPRRIGEI